MPSSMCCGECGIEFSVPDNFYNERKNNGGDFYCPNGHCRAFREPEVQKLRRERDRLAQQIAQRDDEIATKERLIKRMQKRSAAGTCPCCNRTFSNMSRHMKTKHPQFVQSNIVPLKAKK